MDKATEVKNQEILLASLRNEIIEASTALSKIYADHKSVKESIKDAEEELAIIKSESLTVLETVANANKNLDKRIADVNAICERAANEVKVLKVQKKEAMSELKRLNEWIFTAQETLKVITEKTEKLIKKADEKDAYISDIADFKALKESAEADYRDVLVNAKLTSDDIEYKTHKLEEKEKDAEAKFSVLRERTQKEQEKFNDAEAKRLKVEADLKIYIKRVEVAYKQQFPDKKFKI